MAFNVVDGRRRGAPSCAQLRYDPESRQWAITVSAGAGPEDVPMLTVPFVERGQREIGHEWAYRWVRERVVPSGRQNLGEVLRTHDLQEYDEFPLLASSRA